MVPSFIIFQFPNWGLQEEQYYLFHKPRAWHLADAQNMFVGIKDFLRQRNKAQACHIFCASPSFLLKSQSHVNNLSTLLIRTIYSFKICVTRVGGDLGPQMLTEQIPVSVLGAVRDRQISRS